MKIKELIKILQFAPDKEKDVYIESLGNYFTTNIITSFDDNNDVRICEGGGGDDDK